MKYSSFIYYYPIIYKNLPHFYTKNKSFLAFSSSKPLSSLPKSHLLSLSPSYKNVYIKGYKSF